MYTLATTDDIPTLAPVATTGSYNDLIDTPTLATVAKSGSYNDLTDKPEIPSRLSYPFLCVFQDNIKNVEFSINGTDYYNSGNIIHIDDNNPIRVNLKALNPKFGTGLSASFNKATKALGVAIDTTTVALKSDIPTIPTLATVATSGSYNDLTDKPTIPTTATSTSTVTPTTTQLVFTYADNTTETVTLMTAATVDTTTTLS